MLVELQNIKNLPTKCPNNLLGRVPGKCPNKLLGRVPGKRPNKLLGRVPGERPNNLLGACFSRQKTAPAIEGGRAQQLVGGVPREVPQQVVGEVPPEAPQQVVGGRVLELTLTEINPHENILHQDIFICFKSQVFLYSF